MTGAAAESRACWWLRLYGWRICARNWIGGGGELDIVASRWRTLLIVEVRQRTTLAMAMASIDEEKISKVTFDLIENELKMNDQQRNSDGSLSEELIRNDLNKFLKQHNIRDGNLGNNERKKKNI